MNYSIETVICIPGIWENLDVFENAVKELGEEFIIVGNSLFDVKNDQSYNFEMYNFDKNLWKSFYYAGLEKKDTQKVKKHRTCIYINSITGNLNHILNFCEIVSKLLTIGGIGVKIESSGLAVSKEKWLEVIKMKDVGNVTDLFIAFISDGEEFYSCGMHNLGFPDVWLSLNKNDDVEQLFQRFLKYLVAENPHLKNGDTFRVSNNSPIYYLEYKECTIYPKGDLFFNPFGYWNLKLIP